MDVFGPLSSHLGYLLRRVDVLALSSLRAALGELGLTPARATAVVFIAINPGCDQMALGRALGINRASTMNAVNELVALGLVERRMGQNRRSNALQLTDAGAAARLRIEDITGGVDAAFFGVLSDSERTALRATLAKLLDAARIEEA